MPHKATYPIRQHAPQDNMPHKMLCPIRLQDPRGYTPHDIMGQTEPEGGNCQAQLSLNSTQLQSLLRLALFPVDPATHPPTLDSTL